MQDQDNHDKLVSELQELVQSIRDEPMPEGLRASTHAALRERMETNATAVVAPPVVASPEVAPAPAEPAPSIWSEPFVLIPVAGVALALVTLFFYYVVTGTRELANSPDNARPRQLPVAAGSHHRLGEGSSLWAYRRAADMSRDQFDELLTKHAGLVLAPSETHWHSDRFSTSELLEEF